MTKYPNTQGSPKKKISVWLAALLILLGLFLFAKYRMDKQDASKCWVNRRNFQTWARSYASMEPEKAGPRDPVDAAAVYKFVSYPPHKVGPCQCPIGGSYTVHGCYGDPPGTLFLRCSHPKHQPDPAETFNW